MALTDFQKALYDMIANPAICLGIRQHNSTLLENYVLTEKERNRLISVANQKGMNTNCTLYRINRVTPLYTMMPYTCKLLDSQLLPLLSEFWKLYQKTNLQFKDEVRLFQNFLKNKPIQKPYFKDVLELEGKMNELRFNENYNLKDTNSASSYHLNSCMRLIRFSCNPKQLLDYLTNHTLSLSADIEEGEYFLLVEQKEDEISMKVIPSELGKILLNIEKYDVIPDKFIEEGLVEQNIK